MTPTTTPKDQNTAAPTDKSNSDATAQPQAATNLLQVIARSPYNKDGRLLETLNPILAGAGEDLDDVRKHLETWYDAAMDRATGWYKRKLQTMTFCVAFGIVFVFNADALMIFDRLYTNPAERQIIVGQAQALAQTQSGKTPTAPTNVTGVQAPTLTVSDVSPEAKNALTGLLGWSNDPKDFRHFPSSAMDVTWKPFKVQFHPPAEWILKILGLALTAYAASLGAPFWFDMLNRFINIRSAGPAPGEVPRIPQSKTEDRIKSSSSGADGNATPGKGV